MIKRLIRFFFTTHFNITTFFIVVSGILIVANYLHKMKWLKENLEILTFFGYSAIFLSVIVAALQFRANNRWRKKEKALAVSQEVRKEIEPHMGTINKHFQYYQKKVTDKNIVIPVTEIHDKICMKNKDGEYLPADPETSFKYKLDTENEGSKIRTAIITVLNLFEYIAAGIYHDTFDREVIYSIYAGIFIKYNKVFSEYINHYRYDMNPARKDKIWINFTNLAEELEKKSK